MAGSSSAESGGEKRSGSKRAVDSAGGWDESPGQGCGASPGRRSLGTSPTCVSAQGGTFASSQSCGHFILTVTQAADSHMVPVCSLVLVLRVKEPEKQTNQQNSPERTNRTNKVLSWEDGAGRSRKANKESARGCWELGQRLRTPSAHTSAVGETVQVCGGGSGSRAGGEGQGWSGRSASVGSGAGGWVQCGRGRGTAGAPGSLAQPCLPSLGNTVSTEHPCRRAAKCPG